VRVACNKLSDLFKRQLLMAVVIAQLDLRPPTAFLILPSVDFFGARDARAVFVLAVVAALASLADQIIAADWSSHGVTVL
jgi:hypothetical protein